MRSAKWGCLSAVVGLALSLLWSFWLYPTLLRWQGWF